MMRYSYSVILVAYIYSDYIIIYIAYFMQPGG